MKKVILNLGEALKREEQREIAGGGYPPCNLQLNAMCRDPYGGGYYDCCAVGSCQYIHAMQGSMFGVWRCVY
jgi:hypothetical protein